jgi:hypothetical protein
MGFDTSECCVVLTFDRAGSAAVKEDAKFTEIVTFGDYIWLIFWVL